MKCVMTQNIMSKDVKCVSIGLIFLYICATPVDPFAVQVKFDFCVTFQSIAFYIFELNFTSLFIVHVCRTIFNSTDMILLKLMSTHYFQTRFNTH